MLHGHGVVAVQPEGAQALKLAGATPGRDGEHAKHEMADVVAAVERHILAKAATHSGPVPSI